MTDEKAEKIIDLLCGDYDKETGWFGGLKGIHSALSADSPESIKDKLDDINHSCCRIAEAIEALVSIAERNTPN